MAKSGAKAAPLLVVFRVGEFVVVEHCVNVRQHLFHEGPGYVAGVSPNIRAVFCL